MTKSNKIIHSIILFGCLLINQTMNAQVDTLKIKKKNEFENNQSRQFEKQLFDLNMILKQEGRPAMIVQAESLIVGQDELEGISGRKRLVGPSQFDSRIETRKLDPLVDSQNHILTNATSVALVMRKENLQQVTDTLFQIGTGLSLARKYNLCPGEPFANQPVAGIGTAFLTSSEECMSAAHVFEDNISQYAIVFGFEVVNKVGAFETYIPAKNIYFPTQIIFEDLDLDVILIRLDRETDRLPLKLSDKKIKQGNEIYMIGHPCGLPQKVSLNARIFSENEGQYFTTTLDAFQGNSGSPVFNMQTHEVIGILVSGETDYVWTGSCNVTATCRIPYCKGEKAILITQVVNSIHPHQE